MAGTAAPRPAARAPWWRRAPAAYRPGSRARWWCLAVAAVAVPVAAWLIPGRCGSSPEELLAMELGESDPAVLFLNLPPRPSRYPGAVLLDARYALVFVEREDADLRRGEEFRLRSTQQSSTSASGTIGAAVFEEVARGSDLLQIAVEVPRGQVVEMAGLRLAERLRETGLAGSVPTAPIFVVVRAFEGPVTYRLSRRRSTAIEAWTSLRERLELAAAADADLRVSVEASSTQEGDLLLETLEPVVFAYTVARGDAFDGLGVADAPRPVRRTVVGRTEPERAAEELLRLDPRLLPDAARTVREIGPAALPVLQRELESPDRERQRRGFELMREIPPAGAVPRPGAWSELGSASLEMRLRVVDALAADGTVAAGRLGEALDDPAPIVRALAAERLLELGPDAAPALPPLERASSSDADPEVRSSSAAALLVVRPEAAPAPQLVEAALVSPAVRSSPALRARLKDLSRANAIDGELRLRLLERLEAHPLPSRPVQAPTPPR